MSDCQHPKSQRDVSISHLGDPDWAYCLACQCVLHREDGTWVVSGVPGQITKASYSYGRSRRAHR